MKDDPAVAAGSRHRTADPVAFWARVRPERVALLHRGESWSYRDLEAAVSESAAALAESGIGRGEPVSIESEDGAAFAVSLHALHRVGAIPVPIGVRLTEAERQALRDRARVQFTLEPGSAGVAARRSPAGPASHAMEAGEAPSGDLPARDLRDPAALVFTSGTEGEPRAVLLPHRSYFWSALASARNLGVRADDVWLACLPLHHVGGHSILTRSAYYGTAVFLHDRFSAEAALEAIERGAATLVSLVSPMLEQLLAARGGRPDFARLRAALVGGGPAPSELLEEAAARGFKALPTYGLTETASQVTTLSPLEWPHGLGTAGRPLPFTRLELRGAAGAEPVAEGEIVVQGPSVMLGYLDDLLAGRESLDGGWLRTGDFGAWDRDGRLVVLDRRRDRIVTGGENVSPSEVERVLMEHPDVREACVIGIPAGAWGEEVVAVVALRPGSSLTLESLRAYAATRLARHKLPRRLELTAELPRGTAGKLLRRVVRSRLLDEVGAEDRP